MQEYFYQWDRNVFLYFNQLIASKYDSYWLFITQLDHWIPLYLSVFILFFFVFNAKKATVTSAFLLLTVTITFLLTAGTKAIFQRVRPNNVKDFGDLIKILETPSNYSFFSGHAAFAFAFTTFTVLSLRNNFRAIYLLYAWAFAICFSRLYVGVHYPTDLLIGIFVGSGVAYLFYVLQIRLLSI